LAHDQNQQPPTHAFNAFSIIPKPVTNVSEDPVLTVDPNGGDFGMVGKIRSQPNSKGHKFEEALDL
jgi:hypothetical protein